MEAEGFRGRITLQVIAGRVFRAVWRSRLLLMTVKPFDRAVVTCRRRCQPGHGAMAAVIGAELRRKLKPARKPSKKRNLRAGEHQLREPGRDCGKRGSG